MTFDAVVIGGGVLGTAVAARLSATTASVCLLEAAADVCEGASKGNAGVAVSYYGPPGAPETELINRSYPGWEALCRRLDVPYRRLGAVMVALEDHEAERLGPTLQEMRDAGVRGRWLDPGQVRRLEPLVTDRCVAGLHMPDEGVIDPMALTVAYARLAVVNGVSVRLGARVTLLGRQLDGSWRVGFTGGSVRGRFVVNAAGTGAGVISALAGGEALRCWPRKGVFAVLDRVIAERLSHIVFCAPSGSTKGINVVPTTHGSALLGPTALDHDDPGDKATDPASVAAVIASAARLVPVISRDFVIKTFAANRPAGDEPHRLRFDRQVGGLIHCTNRSAGVSISPAAAEEVLALLRQGGLEVEERADAVRVLPGQARLRSRLRTLAEAGAGVSRVGASRVGASRVGEREALLGQVVCGCEQVSAAEIDRALEAPVGATSVEGVRKRTGAGYGRCQGAWCGAGVASMVAGAGVVPVFGAGAVPVFGAVGGGEPFLVVGAGPSGLGFATELAREGPVVLFDRRLVTGGTACGGTACGGTGWGETDVRRVTEEARGLGVVLRLGESALRWESTVGGGGVLVVAAPGRFERVAGRQLIVACGLRPATAARLGITGDRPAGVVAGPVAQELLRAGVRLWDTVVVLGDGPWARGVAERARALGTRVIALGGTGGWGDERLDWPERLTVIGRSGEVMRLRLHTGQAVTDVACDAVVLAADPGPSRDIDGALLEGAPAVTFHQPVRPYDAAGRYELAVRSARSWRQARSWR